jgi:uncharacterized protein (DUF58 family)
MSRPGMLGQTMARSYLVFVLLGAVLAGSAPQAWIALALLVLQSLALYWAPSPRWDVPLALVTVSLAPMPFVPVLGPIAATAIPLPGLLLLEKRLRDLAGFSEAPVFRPGRRSTPTLHSLVMAILAIGFLGFTLGSVTTVLVAGALLLGILAILAIILVGARGTPLSVEPATLRLLVGNQGQARFSLRNNTALSQRAVLFSSDERVTLSPREVEISSGRTQEIVVAATPSLSGPADPKVQAVLLDPWGLVSRGIILHPLKLHAIPRARYAAWLARQYLEQPGSSQLSPVFGHLNDARGVEFQRLRVYHPGDRLKDVDWRRSWRSRELVTKEYRDPPGGRTVIVVNLVAGNSEEADWIGYHLITSALTAARESISSSLAAYNHRGPVLTAGPIDPRGTVKHALRVSEDIALVEGQKRLLAPPQPLHLRRAAQSLGRDRERGPETVLAQVLLLEIQALEDLAQGHPLSLALRSVLKESPPPATVTLVSQWNHDAEALAVLLPRLEQLGYRVLDMRKWP